MGRRSPDIFAKPQLTAKQLRVVSERRFEDAFETMAQELITLPPYVAKLEDALQQELTGAEIRHEKLRPDRYAFEVLWRPFDEIDHADRQRTVWNIVKRTVAQADIMKIAMIRTPDTEWLPERPDNSTQPQPAYVDQLIDAFTEALAGAEVDFERLRSDRYRFAVVWDRFDPMEHPERQQIVWRIAEKSLNETDLAKVVMILTLGHEDLPQEEDKKQQ
jgi:hypothetical protein